MALLDSDILVGLLRNDLAAKKEIRDLIEEGNSLSTSTITCFELFKGAFLSKRREDNLKEVYSLLQNLRVLPFDYKASFLCAQKFSQLSEDRKEISLADLMIASIALAERETLVTRNKKDFSLVKGLEMQIW